LPASVSRERTRVASSVLEDSENAGKHSSALAAQNSGSEPPHFTRDGLARSAGTVVTYREFVTRRTSPRDLAREIVARSQLSGGGLVCGVAGLAGNYGQLQGSDTSREKIDAIYLSPDAFARRTDEASIAEQMGDVFAAAGFPRPIPADDDRVGGWMLMYQMLDAGEWLLTENCIELIRTLPGLVRDTARVEDVEKMDGDDPADAARYGLKSRYANRRAGQTRLPFDERLAARVLSPDPTIRAIQARKAAIDVSCRAQPVSFVRRWRNGANSRNR
jgi:hypothetical protein